MIERNNRQLAFVRAWAVSVTPVLIGGGAAIGAWSVGLPAWAVMAVLLLVSVIGYAVLVGVTQE